MSNTDPITCPERNDLFVHSNDDDSEGTIILYCILFIIYHFHCTIYIFGFDWNRL